MALYIVTLTKKNGFCVERFDSTSEGSAGEHARRLLDNPDILNANVMQLVVGYEKKLTTQIVEHKG